MGSLHKKRSQKSAIARGECKINAEQCVKRHDGVSRSLWRPSSGSDQGLNSLVTVRVLAMGKSTDTLVVRGSGTCRMTQFPLENTLKRSHDALEAEFPSGQPDYHPLYPTTEGTNMANAREERLMDYVEPLLQQTYRSMTSNNSAPCQQITHIYDGSGQHRLHATPIDPPKRSRAQSLLNRAQNASHPSIEDGDSDGHHPATTRLILDFVSRFSVDDPHSAINRLGARFSGSLDSQLERSPSFYPEQYATSACSNIVCVSAILPSARDPRSLRFFLTFQEKCRRWRRVIVVATFHKLKALSGLLQSSFPANMGSRYFSLPIPVQASLRTTLQRIEHFSPVTNVAVDLEEDEDGQMTSVTKIREIAEDTMEKAMSDENGLLQDIRTLGCRQFQESQISLKARISCYRYKVWASGRDYIQRKVPFASAGLQGDNVFRDFAREVKRLNSLRQCTGVLQFIGVVLDDTGQHLKGYLCEGPVVHDLRGLFGLANGQSKTLPWPVRQLWISQIVSAMSEIHARDLVVGALNMSRINIKIDGTAVLDLSDSAHRHLFTNAAYLPPELDNTTTWNTGRVSLDAVLNTQTDVFQLGFFIWLVAEHRGCPVGYYCVKDACTSFPQYRCTAAHADPKTLPACSASIPSYVNDIIKACRSADPSDRPPASWLRELFPPVNPADRIPAIVTQLLTDYTSLPAAFFTFCNECGEMPVQTHYHCYICHSGDFDLCLTCVAEGVCCWNPQHELVRRMVKNGDLVDLD